VKPVDLNFSASPFRNNTPFYIGYALGALVLIAFTTYNTWAFVHYSRGNTTLGETYAANRAKLESLRRDATDLQGVAFRETAQTVSPTWLNLQLRLELKI